MNFASDNAYGAAPEILAALSRANEGAVSSYGDDGITARLRERASEVFEREVEVWPVVTGTAANALALATLVPQHAAIFCHAHAHIAVDECGAPEFFTHGAKLVPLEGEKGKLAPETIATALDHFQIGFVHHAQPAAISITQATELGTSYRPQDIAAIAALARAHALKIHMDGARLANALAYLDCSPADLTWRAGVDALSFGGTKNGALCAEAVIFFDPGEAGDFEYRRKKSGHLLSKMRFISAQLLAQLEGGLWLDTARRANGIARDMAIALGAISGIEIVHPVEANAIFARVPVEMAARLRAAGAHFYDWAPPQAGRSLVRLVTSFATPERDVARFIEIARA
jgi:threonine aldolase